MICNKEDIIRIAASIKANKQSIVFTNGCFDILHRGHVEYLSKAKGFGDFLILGLNTDNSVRRLKGLSRPINNEQDRAIVIDSLKPVDYVVLFDEDTPYDLIDAIRPDFLVKGGDYTPETVVGSDIVANSGGKVVIIPFVQGKSTTIMIEKISSLD